MQSPDEQIREFEAFARVHSLRIRNALSLGRRIFPVEATDYDLHDSDSIALAKIRRIACPIHQSHPSDPIRIELHSVSLTPEGAIAICNIGWSDGVMFLFATELERTLGGEYEFVQSFPYDSHF